MADRFGYGEIGLDIHPCRGCEDYDAPDGCKSNGGCGMTQTNADRIRSMTDEELAESLGILVDCRECSHRNADDSCNIIDGSCQTQWLEWLKQEADG